MPENEIKVWVTWFKDRNSYVLQWRDPDNDKLKSKSAETNIVEVARMKATVLQADLNRGFHKDAFLGRPVALREPAPRSSRRGTRRRWG